MPKLLATLMWLSATSAHADCTPQSTSWITLEVVAVELAGNEPVEVIDIDRAGCLSVRYPRFDRRAGLYRRPLASGEQVALAKELQQRAILRFDTEQVRATLDAHKAAGNTHFHVAGGDTYRLSVEDAAGAVQIEWHAPRQWARRYPEITALQDLVALIQSLQTLAADPARTRVADVP